MTYLPSYNKKHGVGTSQTKVFRSYAMSFANRRRRRIILGVLLFALMPSFFLLRNSFYNESTTPVQKCRKELYPDLMHWEPRCQRTAFQPFRVGCPATCVGYRPDAREEEPYYRTNIAWYFGQPDHHDDNNDNGGDALPRAYDKGINYECPVEVVHDFRRARNRLSEIVLGATTDLIPKHQARMHISLAYVCCLREDEIHWIHQAFHDWILERYPFEIPLQGVTPLSLVNDLQCWHERDNSVSNILVMDAASQCRLQLIYDDLMQYILQRTNGRVRGDYVRHDQQMPFHMTLMGFHRCPDEPQGFHNASCAIKSADLELLYNGTQTVMQESHTRASHASTGSVPKWVVRHAPRHGHSPKQHTWPKEAEAIR